MYTQLILFYAIILEQYIKLELILIYTDINLYSYHSIWNLHWTI